MKTQIKNSELIGKYVSRKGYSDVNIRGKIVGTYGKCGILIQKMNAVKDNVKREWQAGGFSAICLNNENQDWEFEITDFIIKERISKSFLNSNYISDSPVHYYDYNF